MGDILICYNICGISGKENVQSYLENIYSILNQTIFLKTKTHLVISSCMSSSETINRLVEEFGSKVSFNLIKEVVPVNVSFNHSCQKISKLIDIDSFVYVDSGITFSSKTTLEELLIS